MPRVLGTSKVTRKFQVTIPKLVRELLGISENDIIVFEEEEGKVFIRKG